MFFSVPGCSSHVLDMPCPMSQPNISALSYQRHHVDHVGHVDYVDKAPTSNCLHFVGLIAKKTSEATLVGQPRDPPQLLGRGFLR